MILKRVIGLVFAGALAFSAMAASCGSHCATANGDREAGSSAKPQPCVDFRDITIGMADITCGSKEGGNSHRGRMPGG